MLDYTRLCFWQIMLRAATSTFYLVDSSVRLVTTSALRSAKHWQAK